MRPAARSRALAALAFAVLLFGVALVLAFRTEQRHRLDAESSLRTAGWIAFQSEREQLRLAQASFRLAAEDGLTPADVELHLELLVSRIDLMLVGDESRSIWAEPRLADAAQEARARLHALEPAILALRPGDRAGFSAIEPELAAIGALLRDVVQDLMVNALAERGAAVEESALWEFVAFLVCMLATVALLVGLLLRELRSRSALLRRATAAEASAVRERERLADAIDAAEDAFALFDSDDRLVVANARYRGPAPDAIVEGARYEEIVRAILATRRVPDAEGREEEWLQERLAQHRAPGEPTAHQLADGRWFRFSERRTRDGGTVLLRTDITAIKKRETELAELARANEEARLQLLEAIEAFPGSFVLHDSAERIVLWNSKRETLYGDQRHLLSLGVSAEELLRRAIAEGHYPGAAGREEEMVAEILAWHRSPGTPREIQTAEGRWIRLENRRTAVGGVVSVGLDVTEEKERERRFVQAQKMEAVGQLTGGVAHDFNNLLLVVKGNADWALETLALDARERKPLEAVRAAAERGASLVRHLLAFSRKQQLAPKVVDANERVGALARMLRRTLGEQIEIRMSLAAPAPAVRIDPAQLDTAVLNLAINARDAMPNGGALTLESADAEILEKDAARLEVAPGRYVRLTVADDGAGMAPEVAERAFEPFFTTKDVGKGTGLGLSMVYGLLRQSGGSAEIRSAPGRGCAVDLYLPAVRAPEKREAPLASAAPPRGGSEAILVVEDDDAVRELVTALLAGLGYRILSAANGREALTLLRGQAAIDLLLTDLMMPGGLGGLELAEQAQKLRPGLRVLFTSGYSAETAANGSDPILARRLLRKPYMRSELADAVRLALEERAQADAA